MKLKIMVSTDNKNLGFEFIDKFPIILPNGAEFSPDKTLQINNMYKFSTSNYVIECIKVK